MFRDLRTGPRLFDELRCRGVFLLCEDADVAGSQLTVRVLLAPVPLGVLEVASSGRVGEGRLAVLD